MPEGRGLSAYPFNHPPTHSGHGRHTRRQAACADYTKFQPTDRTTTAAETSRSRALVTASHSYVSHACDTRLRCCSTPHNSTPNQAQGLIWKATHLCPAVETGRDGPAFQPVEAPRLHQHGAQGRRQSKPSKHLSDMGPRALDRCTKPPSVSQHQQQLGRVGPNTR